MNPSPRNGLPPSDGGRDSSRTGEDTLRLIAGLPPPEGLPDRVRAGLRSAPASGMILSWPRPLRPFGGWVYSSVTRGAAAAAIVCVVAGGGWRIYSHVRPAPSARVIVLPPRVAPGGSGFSQAGAKRVPETLEGPKLSHPVKSNPEMNRIDKTPASPKAPPGRGTAKRKKATPAAAVDPVP